jgi:peptide methionine sulfoxide reductase MsrA
MQGVADYGKLGHGEVVNMKLPTNRIADFCSVYFSLYDPRTKDRVDPLDRGGEYRSLIGLPGGTQHPVYPKMEAIAQEAGFTLKAGKGNDPDTLKKQIVYVYDTAEFPF